jgi:hypothetical protein
MSHPPTTETVVLEIPFGLFELTEDWIVQKYDPEPTHGAAADPDPVIVGRNFLTELPTREFFQSWYGRLEGFRHGQTPADSFSCALPIGGDPNEIKIRLVRQTTHSAHRDSGRILVQISKC